MPVKRKKCFKIDLPNISELHLQTQMQEQKAVLHSTTEEYLVGNFHDIKSLCVICRMPAIDNSTGEAMTWMSGPSCASVNGLSSTACFEHNTQLYGVSTASEQVPVCYRLKDSHGGTLASLAVSISAYRLGWSACIAKDMLVEYLIVKTEGALAWRSQSWDRVQMRSLSLSPCCWNSLCILPPCSRKGGFQAER